jgi:hypothetical protein
MMSAPIFGCSRIFWNSSGERAWLRQNVFGHRELADVVQQRRGAHALHFERGQAHLGCEVRGVELHAPDVRV